MSAERSVFVPVACALPRNGNGVFWHEMLMTESGGAVSFVPGPRMICNSPGERSGLLVFNAADALYPQTILIGGVDASLDGTNRPSGNPANRFGHPAWRGDRGFLYYAPERKNWVVVTGSNVVFLESWTNPETGVMEGAAWYEPEGSPDNFDRFYLAAGSSFVFSGRGTLSASDTITVKIPNALAYRQAGSPSSSQRFTDPCGLYVTPEGDTLLDLRTRALSAACPHSDPDISFGADLTEVFPLDWRGDGVRLWKAGVAVTDDNSKPWALAHGGRVWRGARVPLAAGGSVSFEPVVAPGQEDEQLPDASVTCHGFEDANEITILPGTAGCPIYGEARTWQ